MLQSRSIVSICLPVPNRSQNLINFFRFYFPSPLVNYTDSLSLEDSFLNSHSLYFLFGKQAWLVLLRSRPWPAYCPWRHAPGFKFSVGHVNDSVKDDSCELPLIHQVVNSLLAYLRHL